MLDVYGEAVRLMEEAVAGKAPHVLDAMLDLGPRHFAVSRDIFHQALLRDRQNWQMSWSAVDREGVEVCVGIMRELGALARPLEAGELFDVPRRKRSP